jgi:hypothetical protein
MKIPSFAAEASIYRSSRTYLGVDGARASPENVIMPQVPFLYCALHAGACGLLTENPAAAYLWWVRFAQVCGTGNVN